MSINGTFSSANNSDWYIFISISYLRIRVRRRIKQHCQTNKTFVICIAEGTNPRLLQKITLAPIRLEISELNFEIDMWSSHEANTNKWSQFIARPSYINGLWMVNGAKDDENILLTTEETSKWPKIGLSSTQHSLYANTWQCTTPYRHGIYEWNYPWLQTALEEKKIER